MFEFPDDACWNEQEDAVEFSIRLGDYAAKVFLPRRALQSIVGARPRPEECIVYFHLNRTEIERVAEDKVSARQLDDDANIRITSRDLRAFRPS